MIYFDNAATTGHKPKEVINAVNYALINYSANPGRSGHNASQKAAQIVYNAREILSDFFESDGPETVVFTQNCTQSINIVLKGVLEEGDHIVISDLEHNAIMRPLTAMGINYTMAKVSLVNDHDTVQNFMSAIKPNTKMIFCTAASNVLGKMLPLQAIGKLCKERGILFAVDAAQGAGHMTINMKNFNIHYLCVAPHKGLYCPMGFGILIARAPIKKTIIEGGTGTESINLTQPQSLPEKFESGTLNLPAIASVKEGIDFIKKKGNSILKYENYLIKRFYSSLKNSNIIFYTNPLDDGYVPVISFNVDGIPSENVATYLNRQGFALRAGLHCAPSAHKKIGTLKEGTVRFSPSIFNSVQNVDSLVINLKKISKIAKFSID